MNDKKMLLRLMWKDLQTVKSLLLAATVSIVFGNLLVFLFWHQGEMRADTYVGFTYTLWFLLPGFTALGVPAMIVGTEEETGTGNWLRTLPVSWQTIARAKLWVAARGRASHLGIGIGGSGTDESWLAGFAAGKGS